MTLKSTLKPARLGNAARNMRDDLSELLKKYGVTDFKIAKTSAHPKLHFDVGGKHIQYPLPGTPSDWRSIKNTVLAVRRVLEQNGLKPIPAPVKKPTLIEEVVPEPMVESVETIERPVEQPIEPVNVQPEQTPLDFWSKVEIPIQSGRPLVYVPRPVDQAVIVLPIDDDLALLKGEVLIINLAEGRVFHLPQQQLDAIYQPSTQSSQTIKQAFESITPKVEKVVAPNPEPKPHREARHGVGSQMGRALIMMQHLQLTNRTNKITSEALREAMDESDKKSVSSVLSKAQELNYVAKTGPVPSNTRAYYYHLTEAGSKMIATLGTWPFDAAGLKPPSNVTSLPLRRHA